MYRNVLYGSNGASYIYAPQKGADAQQVKFLDDGLKNLAAVLLQQTGKDIANLKGSGAAGGIAASLISFFDVELKQGIDMILSVSDIDKQIKTAALVITGEGKIDRQSMDGKVIARIAALANERNIPVIALCGKLELNADDIKKTGLSKAFAIGASLSLRESMNNAGKLITQKTMEVISSLFSANQ